MKNKNNINNYRTNLQI